MLRFGRVKVKTAPTVEPLTVAEAKLHLRVDHADEDATIERMIVAVREYAEKYLRRSLISTTLQLYLDAFPSSRSGAIYLPRGPVSSVVSVGYTDTTGAACTVASYQSDLVSEPARLLPAYDDFWPDTREVVNAVVVEYVAGYGAAATAVPQRIRAGLLVALSDLFENRGAVVTGTIVSEVPSVAAERLWHPFRLFEQP